MADMMQFELVSPERKLVSGEAVSVQIPGADGDFTAMKDHAPVVATLRPGILVVETGSGTEEYAVTGGFAQVTADGTTAIARFDQMIPVRTSTSSAWIILSASCTATSGLR